MRLIDCHDLANPRFEDYFGRKPPPYAILSHTWGADGDEVSFKEFRKGTGRDKAGYGKIQFCAEQAGRDGLQYIWVDTCCIDKSSSAELAKAINSMFSWYRDSTKCYVYMPDVSIRQPLVTGRIIGIDWEKTFRKSRWFTRGWTLQELVAPSSVHFFSAEEKWIGDKMTLEQQISDITGIGIGALRGDPLSGFSVDERLSWASLRHTKEPEDKAYCLLGLFDVHMPLIYGEGGEKALARLREEMRKSSKGPLQQQECVQHLYSTDPRDDKKRIEETKGGLLGDSYRWILENTEYLQWQNDQQSSLLWIKGDPGKGKTMLLCGIIDELKKSIAETNLLSYFFCQANDTRINNAPAVLRGLIYLLVVQQPLLVSHIKKKYDHAGKSVFEDANAWFALSEILGDILQDPSLNTTYLIIDALDECVVDLPKLLGFITQLSAVSSRVKWVISSRNWPDIEEQLESIGHEARLSLELNSESVVTAVGIYIQHKVVQLARRKKYSEKTCNAVIEYLSCNADNTFLWVGLVCQNLEKISRWNTVEKLKEFPPGLDSLYARMLEKLRQSDSADLCKRILATMSIVYRPITLYELVSLVEMPEEISDDLESVMEIVNLCGSFLTIREDTIYFVHQSAKDYLLTEAPDKTFSSGSSETHHAILLRSLQTMFSTLRRDIYSLDAPGYPIEQIERPDPDPLVASRYSCVYWVDHLCDWNPSCANDNVDLQDGGIVEVFIRKKYLYWLEALALCRSMSEGVLSVIKLDSFMQERADASTLTELIRDASRFIMYHKQAIENSPLQAYASALLFSPARSLIRNLFKHEEPKTITIQPTMNNEWSPCLQTLERHSDGFNDVTFSPDGRLLAAASYCGTVTLWDASSGTAQRTLGRHLGPVTSIDFSPDGTLLASSSRDGTIKIWDANARSGVALQTLQGHKYLVNAVTFSPDGRLLASASADETVNLWNTRSGEVVQTLEGHKKWVSAVVFSPDGELLASASMDLTVKLWDAKSGAMLQSLEIAASVCSVAFSPDGKLLGFVSGHDIVTLWDVASKAIVHELRYGTAIVLALLRDGKRLAFSPDNKRLALASGNSFKLLDVSSGVSQQTFEGHLDVIKALAFSPNGKLLASASLDGSIKLWDAILKEKVSSGEKQSAVNLCHEDKLLRSSFDDGTIPFGSAVSETGPRTNFLDDIVFSPDGKLLATTSGIETLKLWNVKSRLMLKLPEKHGDEVFKVAFSPDSKFLASVSFNKEIRLWDPNTGARLTTLDNDAVSLGSIITFSRDSKLLAAGIGQKVYICNLRLGTWQETLGSHADPICAVVFSPDGKLLVSASAMGTLCLWDASSRTTLPILEGHARSVNAVVFSPDSKVLASASLDGTVKLWDCDSGGVIRTIKTTSNRSTGVAFLPDGKLIVLESYGHTVKLWDFWSEEILQTLEFDVAVFTLSLTNDGKFLQTDRGHLLISNATSSRPSVTPSLFITEKWVVKDAKRILWLPPEYRPFRIAVHGSLVCLGCGSGRVWLVETAPHHD